MMKSSVLALTMIFALAAGCGSSSSGGGTGGSSATGTGGTAATGGTTGTGGTTATGGAAGSGATDAGPVMYTLTLTNYLAWCTVTENSATSTATMSFAPGTVVDLNATANLGFVWGYWTGTDGDTTASHDKNMTTTVTMTSDKSVLACCPLPPSQTCP